MGLRRGAAAGAASAVDATAVEGDAVAASVASSASSDEVRLVAPAAALSPVESDPGAASIGREWAART